MLGVKKALGFDQFLTHFPKGAKLGTLIAKTQLEGDEKQVGEDLSPNDPDIEQRIEQRLALVGVWLESVADDERQQELIAEVTLAREEVQDALAEWRQYVPGDHHGEAKPEAPPSLIMILVAASQLEQLLPRPRVG